MSNLHEYIEKVRERIIAKQQSLEQREFNSLDTIEKISYLLECEQLDMYLEFVNEFEKIVMDKES